MGSSTGVNAIKITFSSSSNQVGLTSFTVTYAAIPVPTSFGVTYDANGATSGDVPTDDSEYDAENNTVTVAGNDGSLDKLGYNWTGWALNAEGTGTIYGPSYTETYTITANTTFFAKWTAKVLNSIRGVTTTPTNANYIVGDAFDPTGLIIYATIDGAEVETNVASSMVWNDGNGLSFGQTTVEGKYIVGETTKTIEITGITVDAPASVTFVAGTDKGTTTVNNTPDSMEKSIISIESSDGAFATSEYRFYSGSSLTVSTSVGAMAKIEFYGVAGDNKMDDISLSSGGGSIAKDGNDATWTGESDSVTFSFSAQNRATSIVITMVSTDPLVELDTGSASSVTVMKGNSDTSVKVLVKNIDTPEWTFTYDEDETVGKTTSSYIGVVASSLVDNVATLTITTKAVGSTTLHIDVSGTDCTTTIPVTVNPKPASMSAKLGGVVVTSTEIQNNSSYKQFTFEGLDTDDTAYSITAADVTGAIQSGDDCVTISGTRVTAKAVGECVVRYSLNVLPSVYADVTVSVLDDFNASVNEITFNDDLADTQGEHIDIAEVFETKVANTHFGSTAPIADDELRFSYDDNDFEGAVAASSFAYDFSHGEAVDPTHKQQTVYVYTTFTGTRVASFSINITQANNPLTAIALDTGDELNLQRNTTHQLVVSYTPANTTDSKAVTYAVDEDGSDEGHSITVSSTGLISAGNVIGKSALIVVTSVANPAITAEVIVTTTLGNMTITADVPETLTPSSTVAIGDNVVFVAVDKNSTKYELTSFSGASTDYGVATSYSTAIAKDMVLTVESGSSSGSVSFKTSDNKYLAWVDGKNSITPKAGKDAYGSWIVDGDTIQNVQDENRYLYLNYNNGTPRFAGYADKSEDTSGNYSVPTFVKVAFGVQTVAVDIALFEMVMSHMSTYLDNESVEQLGINICDFGGSALDKDAWDLIGADFTAGIISTYKLNYARANAAGNEVEKFLSAYDYVVGKYGSDYDFFGRIASGKISLAYQTKPFATGLDEGNAGAVITAVILGAGALAAGGLFLTRKRRSEEE